MVYITPGLKDATEAVHIETMERHVRSIDHDGLGFPEVPFGGMLDSGFGDEGGVQALREMTFTRFVSVRSSLS